MLVFSPAVDAGLLVGAPSTDFDGDFRSQDGNGDGRAGFDIGADEVAADTARVYLPIVLLAVGTTVGIKLDIA